MAHMKVGWLDQVRGNRLGFCNLSPEEARSSYLDWSQEIHWYPSWTKSVIWINTYFNCTAILFKKKQIMAAILKACTKITLSYILVKYIFMGYQVHFKVTSDYQAKILNNLNYLVPGWLSSSIILYTVSVLGREEGYTMKYGLSPRKFPRAQAMFHRISWLES